MVGGDNRDVYRGSVGEFAIAADQGGVTESTGGYDVKGVVDGEVVTSSHLLRYRLEPFGSGHLSLAGEAVAQLWHCERG